MSNPLPLRQLRGPIVDAKGNPTRDFMLWLRDLEQKTGPALDIKGQVQATTKVSGRQEQIGTTLQNVDAAGTILAPGVDFARAYANKNTDNIADGTGSPLSGGKRGFQALDTNNRLQNSFRGNPVNVSNTPTSSTTLSNDGVSHAVVIASSTNQFAPGGVAYNSGSIDPGVFQKSYITAPDPTFAGGAVSYSASTTPQSQTSAEGLINFGTLTTQAGVAGTGGGNTGGTKGSAGGRGYNQ
jgi:hypothetical protein